MLKPSSVDVVQEIIADVVKDLAECERHNQPPLWDVIVDLLRESGVETLAQPSRRKPLGTK